MWAWGIRFFPNDKDYAVVTYASIRCLENKLGQSTLIEEDGELAGMFVGVLSQLKADYNAIFSARPETAQAAGGA